MNCVTQTASQTMQPRDLRVPAPPADSDFIDSDWPCKSPEVSKRTAYCEALDACLIDHDWPAAPLDDVSNDPIAGLPAPGITKSAA
jgi:hypothetical protein